MATLVNFSDYQSEWANAALANTLMTPKHDPYNLSTMYQSFRSVLSHDLADNLETFITNGDFTLTIFDNALRNNSPYCVITPNPSSAFNIPASGVTANSVFATSTLDRIVAVSGFTSGWHLFGEDSQTVQQKITNGDLINRRDL